MVEAIPTTEARRISEKNNLPEINSEVVLNKEQFSREENLTAIKVPVL